MHELGAQAAVRGGLSEAISRAKWAGQRTVLTYRGRAAAAVVPIEDLARLERMPPEPEASPRGEGR